MINLHQLLKLMVDKGASDLHITVGSPPQLRIDGRLVAVKAPPMNGPDCRQICYSVLTDAQKQKFEETNELDLSFGVKGLSRFRANLFIQRGAVSGVFRQIPFVIKSITELGLPPIVGNFVGKTKGLILVTGPTGSGKSTTLAAMIDKLNSEKHHHILTIEDPIEYLHPHRKCIVNQREVGSDTAGFKAALRYVLRQDPDVVLIGELRDLETMEAALSIAETGHLCLATLHTNGAIQTINRILDAFPPHQQDQVRAQLSFVLEGVVSQQLVPREGGGRCLALEILVPTPAIRNLIREDKLHQVYSQMQVGQTKYSMQTMNQSLISLYQRGLISAEEALGRTTDVEEMRSMMRDAAPRSGR
ncbi:MAG: type IV pilus twitching motility protein PilT [Deltaproteobacteria bacterium]|nr:MAG: type IV pilus twitching motility protein PilT [Deltaproteobacteria bacterium]